MEVRVEGGVEKVEEGCRLLDFVTQSTLSSRIRYILANERESKQISMSFI